MWAPKKFYGVNCTTVDMCLVQTVFLYLRDERKSGGVSNLTAFKC